MGWQSCADKGSFTNAILQALAKEYHFDLDTPFEEYPQKIHDILIHGTNGKEVMVHYTGQRGSGVYPVAFEGLIKMWSVVIARLHPKAPNRNTKPLCALPL